MKAPGRLYRLLTSVVLTLGVFGALAEDVRVEKDTPLIIRKNGKASRAGVAKAGETYPVLKRAGKWIGVRLPDGRGAWVAAANVKVVEEGAELGDGSSGSGSTENIFAGGHFEPLLGYTLHDAAAFGFGAGGGYGIPVGEKGAIDIGVDSLYYLKKGAAGVSLLISSFHLRYGISLGGFGLAPGLQVVAAMVLSPMTLALDFGGTLAGVIPAGPGAIVLDLRATLRDGTTFFFLGGYRIKF